MVSSFAMSDPVVIQARASLPSSGTRCRATVCLATPWASRPEWSPPDNVRESSINSDHRTTEIFVNFFHKFDRMCFELVLVRVRTKATVLKFPINSSSQHFASK